MGEILWREAPVDADLVISVPGLGQPSRERFRARLGHPPGRRADQEPLRRAYVHPARTGASQARAADEVQSAARDRRRQARGRRRRLDRARQHDPPDRRNAEGRGRARGAPADLGAADPPSMPLRDRHVHPRGDDRPRAHGRGDRPGAEARTRSPTCRWKACTRQSGRPAEHHCDACFTGDYPLGDPEAANGKFALEEIDRSIPVPRAPEAGRRSFRIAGRSRSGAGTNLQAILDKVHGRGGIEVARSRRTSPTRWRSSARRGAGIETAVFERGALPRPRGARSRDRRLAGRAGDRPDRARRLHGAVLRRVSSSASAAGSSTSIRRCFRRSPGSTPFSRRSTMESR